MKNVLRSTVLAASALLLATQAFANPCPPGNPPTNCAPPTGAILDLNGLAVPHVYTQFFVNFVASLPTTNLSFSFREDPAFLHLDDVSVSTGGGANLLVNPGFESGPSGSHTPLGWTYLNEFGVSAAGVVDGDGPRSGSLNYVDGAIQGYDGITQGIATTPGTTYNVSFWLNDDGPLTTFSRLSTNGNVTDEGGNGIDLLVYAGAIPTLTQVPEPASLALMGIGLAGIGFSRRRKSS